MKKLLFLISISCMITACQNEKAAFTAEFEKSFRHSFVESGVASCIKSANQGETARPLCECTIKHIEQNFSHEDMLIFAKNQEPKDMAERINQAMQMCSKKH